MPPVGFEITIPASKRQMTQALDRAATEIGFHTLLEQWNQGGWDGRRMLHAWGRQKCSQGFVWKTTSRRLRCRRENCMKIGLKRTECDVVRWIYVAENRGNGETCKGGNDTGLP